MCEIRSALFEGSVLCPALAEEALRQRVMLNLQVLVLGWQLGLCSEASDQYGHFRPVLEKRQ